MTRIIGVIKMKKIKARVNSRVTKNLSSPMSYEALFCDNVKRYLNSCPLIHSVRNCFITSPLIAPDILSPCKRSGLGAFIFIKNTISTQIGNRGFFITPSPMRITPYIKTYSRFLFAFSLISEIKIRVVRPSIGNLIPSIIISKRESG